MYLGRPWLGCEDREERVLLLTYVKHNLCSRPQGLYVSVRPRLRGLLRCVFSHNLFSSTVLRGKPACLIS